MKLYENRYQLYENYMKIGINYIELLLASNNYLNDSDFLLLFFVIFAVDVKIIGVIC